jgi:tRNA splicing ligase
MGYRWLLDHLGSTMTESPSSLASWVHHYRLTLVAELCDDGFEEHVVPYSTSGLYLHGINYNTTTLRTLPISVVHAVARRFGFLTVDAQSLSTLADVRLLADRVHTDPKWNGGKESEGMVVRCQLDNHDFFFKVKNDTYLVYREYRELTKQLLKVTPEIGVAVPLKKPKVRYEKAWYYVAWLLLRVVDHPEWFAHYLENKGVVKVRLAFEQDWDAGNVALLDVEHVDRWVERDSKGW